MHKLVARNERIGVAVIVSGPEIVIGGQRTALEVPCQHLGKKIAGEVFPPESGLGDYTKSLLRTVGITAERWSWLVGLFVGETKSSGGCSGCDWRHKFLNWLTSGWVGKLLGFGKGKGPELKAALEQLVQVTDLKPRDVYECAIFGKCVPTFKPSAELRVAMLKDMQCGACPGCEKYAARES